MAGRGALIKPWIFKEYAEQRDYLPSAEERIGIYYTLTTYFKEHFGNDDMGKKKAFYFLPWHFSFLCRYRPLPHDLFSTYSRHTPLIQNTRVVDDMLVQAGYISDFRTPFESRNKVCIHYCMYTLLYVYFTVCIHYCMYTLLYVYVNDVI